MLGRGGDDLVYLPAGSPGNEVMKSGPYVILHAADGVPALSWRVDPNGSVEVFGPDEDTPDAGREASEQSPDTSPGAGMPSDADPS